MMLKSRMSRGCESCRKLHVKCDEKHPECSRCVRMKRACTGYRAEVDLMFRPANAKRKYKAQKEGLGSTTPLPPSRMSVDSLHDHSGLVFGDESHLLPKLGRVLLPSREELALSFFYQTTLQTLIASDHALYLHRQFPMLFSRSKSGSALQLATHAIAHAVWAKSRPNETKLSQLARKKYLRSLAALNAAIRDPDEAKSDETLYAVLILSGYETITFGSDTLAAWGTHIDGAAALIKLRGSENFCTAFSCNMFLFYQRSAILNCLQMSMPVDSILEDSAGLLSPYENVEDRLLSKTMRIPNLQALANVLLSQPSSTIDVIEACGLVRAAEDLDRQLKDWAGKIPTDWSYTTVKRMTHPSRSKFPRSSFIPDRINRYPNLYVARVWNLYYVYRLILHSIISRVSSYAGLNSAYNHGTLRDSSSRTMVDGICASVPFLLGYDCSVLKRSTDHLQEVDFLWPQCSATKLSGPGTGRFSLIWPLYVACSVTYIPEVQQRWIRSQLQWLAESGQAHAKVVLDSESQTIVGRAESFRFDCV